MPGPGADCPSGAVAEVPGRGAGVRGAWEPGEVVRVRSGRVLKILLTHVADGLDVSYEKTRGIQEDSEGVGCPGRRLPGLREKGSRLGSWEVSVAHVAFGLSPRHASGNIQERAGLSACTLGERPGRAWADGRGRMVDTQSHGTR